MNRLIRAFFFMCLVTLLGFATVNAAPVPFDPTPRLVIMIMLDGFRPDYVTMYAPPNLQRLVAEGAWVADASSVFPSMTTANQTSFVTGALPRNTGIPNNSRYDRQLDSFVAPLRDNKVPTIGEIMANQGWRTASVNHFMLENRGAQKYVQGNMDSLIKLLETDRSGLIVYYNAETDNAGHRYGPFLPGMRDAVLAADAEIGRLLKALDRLGITDQTTIVVASDHGMSLNDGTAMSPDLTKIIGTGFKVAGDNNSIKPDTELVYIASGSLFLYWRNGKKTPEREAALMAKLTQIEGAYVYTAADLVKLGADPERVGDIVVVPQPGRALSRTSGSGGKHGTLEEMHSTMLFWGTGIKPGTIVGKASITDIVPTLLTLAKVDVPASVDGKPLNGILMRTSWKSRLGVAGSYEVKDVAASDMTLTDLPAYVADGSTFTAWQAPLGGLGRTDAFVALDYGVDRMISAVEIVAGPGDQHLGPRECTLEVSSDGLRYTPVFSGELTSITNGESTIIPLKQPVKGRYLRLTIRSGWNSSTIRIAELRTWAGVPGK